MSQFDEMPAMSSGAAQPAAYPTGSVGGGMMGGPDDEEATMSFEGLSLDQLLSHSHWKGRKHGLEMIAGNVLQYEGAFLSGAGRLAKEANATVQEQIFETAVQVVENGSLSEAQLKELASHVLKLTIEKGITGRPKAAQSALRLLSSLTGQRVHEEVTNALMTSFSHKTPKNRQQSLAACAAIIREYGFQSMAPNVVLKAVSPLFSDANALVRKEVQNVFCQCYRYLGAKIQHYFGDLRDVQVEEMKKSFGELEVGVAPEKTIRGFASATTGARGGGAVKAMALGGEGGSDLEMDDDTFATLEENIVLAKLPKNFYSVALDKTTKWQDRVAMVRDHLYPLLNVRRVRAADDYHELVKCLRELFVDPQAPVMLGAIHCIQQLSKALRQSMGPYVRPLIAPLFEKLKDKKTSVLEHMYLTLNTLLKCKCVTLDALQEEMELVVQSKVPNQRSALISWISGVFDVVDLQLHGARLLRANAMFSKLVNDDKIEVREAAVALLVKMNTIAGDKMQPLLKQLDSKTLMRVLGTGGNKDEDSMMGRLASSIHCGDSPSGHSPMKKVARTEKPGPQGLVKSLSASTLTTAAQRRQTLTSNPNSLSRSTPATTPTTTPGAASGGDDPVALESGLPSKEDAAAKLNAALCGDNEAFSLSVLEQLNAKEWKVRCDAVTALAQCIASSWSVERCTDVLDHLVVFLKNTAVWKDSLFQVVNAGILLLLDCCSRSTIITQRCAFVILQAFTPRLTEPKSKGPSRELLAVVAEGATPKFVMKHMMSIVQAGKNPKLTQEVNDFFSTLLQEFDGTPVDAKSIVDYVKHFCFEQTQPAVKQSAVSLMGSLRKRVGTKLDPFLADVNPHLRSTLDAEFAKSPSVAGASGSASSSTALCEETGVRTRQLKASVASAQLKPTGRVGQQESHAGGGAARPTSLAEEDLPRVDLSHQLAALNREMTGGKDWKARSVAIKKVEELMLSAHKTVSSNGITDTIKALRSRFEETNKNLVVDALKSISVVLESVEAPGARPGMKFILPAVLGLLSDQKANLREEAAKVCAIGVAIIGLDVSIQMLLKPLGNEAPLSRQIAVDVLDKQLEAAAAAAHQGEPSSAVLLPTRTSCIPLVPVLLRLAMDRSTEVRAAAERITAVVGPIVGYEAFQKPIMELKPAEQLLVRGLIERQIDRLQPSNPPPHVALPAHLGGIPFSRSEVATSPSASMGHSTSVPASVPALTGFAKASSSHHLPHGGLGASARTIPPPISPAASSHHAQSVSARATTQEEQPFTVTEIMNGLCHVPQDVAFRMCTDFLKRLRKGEDCGSPALAQVMVDLMLEAPTQRNVDLSLGLINCLCAMFASPRVALRCDCATLVPLLRNIFSCLLSEQFSQCDTVIRALNSMTLKLLEGCQVDEVFGALMSLMAEYSATYLESNSKIDHKYVQVVVKCLMRLDTERVSPNVVIVSCHDYLLQHPPSAFKSRDDLSIRTIKTIMQAVSRKHGVDLLTLAQTLVGSQNLVSHFIKACLESKDRALRARAEAESAAAGAVPSNSLPSSTASSTASLPPPPASVPQRYVDPSSSNAAISTRAYYASSSDYNASASATPASSTASLPPAPSAPPALSNVVPNVVSSTSATSARAAATSKSVGPIFDKIRMHTTSQEGLEELYAHLKTSQKECPDFVFQFNKCSPAFRSFIRRQLEKITTGDATKPEWFVLPEVVLQTP